MQVRWWLVGALGAAACGGGSSGSRDVDQPEVVGGDEARRAVVESIATHVILPAYRDFATTTDELVAATAALATAEATDDRVADVELGRARAAWRASIDAWQIAEVFQLGPAGASDTVVGGQGLRARIYAWPLTNPCRVDQETLAQALLDPAALASAPANVRGLAALEYLLFDEDTGHACPSTSAINADGAWPALAPDEVRRRRAAFAAVVAADVRTSGAALRDAWEPSRGDFLGELVGAADRSTYRNVQAALNAISDALFYLDKETKDLKLAGPLGLTSCASGTCPELVESRFGRRSAHHVVQNIVAFQRAYHGGPVGGDELGFDDLLVGAGATQLATDFGLAIHDALEAARLIADPLEATLASDPAVIEAAHTALSDLNRLMKTQLVSVLDLELPKRVEGDND